MRIRGNKRIIKLRALINLVDDGMTLDEAEAAVTGKLDESNTYKFIAPFSHGMK